MEDREKRLQQLQVPPQSPSPWLVYTHGKTKAKKIQTFCNVTGFDHNKSYIKSIPTLRGNYIQGSSHGWLIIRDFANRNVFSLWDPTTLNLINLPAIESPEFISTMICQTCILTCPPHDNDGCIVLIFCDCSVFAYRLNHDQQHQHGNWVSQRLQLDGLEAKVKQAIVSTTGVIYVVAETAGSCKGSIIDYLVNLDLDVSHSNVNYISVTLGQPMKLELPSPNHCCFPNYIKCQNFVLESGGLIYVVGAYILPCGEYYRITGIKLWHLDLVNVTWVDVDSLDDRAFFLDRNHGSTWCWANNEAGVGPNSIYILVPGDTHNVYMYRLHDRSLTPLCPCPNLVYPWDLPTWLIMPHHHQRSASALQVSIINDDQHVNDIVDTEKLLDLDHNRAVDNYISLLPADLIALLSKRLHMFDYLSFRETCKSFRSQLPLPQWRSHNTLPLFLFSKKDGGLCQFMDPCRNDSRVISIPLPSRCENFMNFSKNGWLIFGMGGLSLKYFNLFTGVSGDFPSFEDMQALLSIGFSTNPTSSNCLTVGIFGWLGTTIIAYHFNGEEAWEIARFTNDEDFDVSPGSSSPVFVDGKFYFLYQSGHLGKFELKEGEPKLTLYEKPELQNTYFNSNHLIECDGQILAVFIGDMGTWVQVFRFSHSEREWVELKDLTKNILFINHSTSFSVAAPEPEMGNKIYFPRLYKNKAVYYSLETEKFHTVGGEHSVNDLYGTSEQLRCCWV